MSKEAQSLCNQIINACNGDQLLEDNITLSSRSILQQDEIGTKLPITVDATCFARAETQCSGSQTYSKPSKTTKDLYMAPKFDIRRDGERTIHVCDVQAIISVNVVTAERHDKIDDVILESRRKPVEVRNVAITKNVRSTSKRGDSITNNVPKTREQRDKKSSHKCTGSLEEHDGTGKCVERTCNALYSYAYGGWPCGFSLGTADYRSEQREKMSNTMLIGGCRVPVCRNFKCKF